MGSLAADLALALDPVRLAQAAGITPDPWQRAVLSSHAPRILLNVTRQGGKSTISSLLAVHTAVYVPESLILLVSPSLRQSAELFRKCLTTYRGLQRPVPASAETQLKLELENGSRIVSLPGQESTLRGYSSVTLLCIDEAARVEDPLYYSLRPMLAVSGGRVICMSTPWGRRRCAHGLARRSWSKSGAAWGRGGIGKSMSANSATRRIKCSATTCCRPVSLTR